MARRGRGHSELSQYDEWEHADRPKFLGRSAADPARPHHGPKTGSERQVCVRLLPIPHFGWL